MKKDPAEIGLAFALAADRAMDKEREELEQLRSDKERLVDALRDLLNSPGELCGIRCVRPAPMEHCTNCRARSLLAEIGGRK